MSALIQALIGIFSTGVGKTVGNTVTNVASIAALSPIALWLLRNKEEQFITLSYGDLAFWGAILFMFIKLAHYSRAGKEE